MIDYGFCTKYIDKKTGSHLLKRKVSCFRGNLLFSSQAQLDFYNTFPKDDLVSLAFLMIYLLRNGSLPNIDFDVKSKMNDKQFFTYIKDTKIDYRLDDLCEEGTITYGLRDFVSEVFLYGFE